MPIRVLTDQVASQIAAGEVVERPASVIKELIENAIDAGASDVRIEVQAGGARQMRVLDDGCGIPAQEVELAFARHSTSKLTSLDDLERIHTLGFRGEALASIASVARVTLVTREREETVGTQLRLEGGQVINRQPSGRPPGTDVTISDLFFNVPARRKFLRTERTERRHIDTLVTRYAMAYPDLRFTLTHSGRTTFQTHGSGDLSEVLVAVYGPDNAGQMLPISNVEAVQASPDAIRVSGYVSAPTLHRSNRSEITIFVNGRWVEDQRLTYAITQAYHTLLMTKRYPLAVVQVALAPQDVDVNVHPAKTQVRFRDGDAVFRAVQRTIRHTLVDQAPVPHIHTPSTAPNETTAASHAGSEWPGAWPTPEQVIRRAQLRAIGARSDRRIEGSGGQFSFDLARNQTGDVRLARQPGDGVGDTTPHEERQESPLPSPTPHQIPPLRVVGQLGLTYVLAEGPEGLFLIDQHAAHERVLYEKFMAQKDKVATQSLLEPATVELTAEGASLVQEHLEALETLGFDVQPFGGNTVLVRAVPAKLADSDPQTLFNEIVADLQVGDAPLAEEIEARIIRRVCKQAAIKAGQKLSRQEMEALIRQLEACTLPRTCPHGRPTMIHMSANQLAQEFGRLG